ncbi:potassium channel family protein [Kiloniella sp.]|uniref:potassium channel family protein n=1 Tax=Kiloniella sp. TaxID=1938587 RepID=UPI003A900C9C
MRNLNQHHFSKWKYGIIYLLLIPLFALFYTMLPNEFYQSTIKQEGIIHYHENQFKMFFKEVLERRIKRDFYLLTNCNIKDNDSNHNSIIQRIHSVSPILQTTETQRISGIWANINLLTQCNDRRWHQTLFQINADIIFGERRKLHFIEFSPLFIMKQKQNNNIFNEINTTENKCNILRASFRTLSFEDNRCFIMLSKSESNEIVKLTEQYHNALTGKISNHNRFMRMLYLSTVTITTLGYGDIVPVTDTSRLLISLESILGIILIGLFLNSIVTNKQ